MSLTEHFALDTRLMLVCIQRGMDPTRAAAATVPEMLEWLKGRSEA